MTRSNSSLLSKCSQMLSRKNDTSRRESKSLTTSSWPRPVRIQGAARISEDDCAPLLDTSYAQDCIRSQRSRSSSRSSSTFKNKDQILTIPSWCRLPSSTRFTTLTYILFTLLLVASSTSAAPLTHGVKHAHSKRQSIPDRFGNTGNDPAPVASQPPPRTLEPSETALSIPSSTSTSAETAATVASTILSEILSETLSETAPAFTQSPPPASPSTTATQTPSPAAPFTPPSGRPEEQLIRTSPSSPFTPGLIAGIAGGTTVVIALIIGIAFFLYRRKRECDIQEIPIRRSKLGSRLGFRMFGSRAEASRSPSAASKYTVRSHGSSRRGSTEKNKELEITTGTGNRSTFGSVSAWLDKGTIGRPKPAYVDTSSQFLELPRPLFADRETEMRRGENAPWRPKRPDADAAPLGRLSGMGFGLGMGRASGIR
ncbi:hypothetical protein IQ07DRAFT_678450 [Pyrenochaeta sp. DS3sAY3a]|nr:hypothetical protein IQ07DRAFT_678450 [Pyrenochaeta sp. DS3sAY3a]